MQSTLLVELDDSSEKLFGAEAAGAKPPTTEALRAALTHTFARIEAAKASGERTAFYFVYSGHGDVAHGEGFVALEDDRLTRTMLFEEILSASPADENHVIIDACRSYFLVFEKGPGGRRRRSRRCGPASPRGALRSTPPRCRHRLVNGAVRFPPRR